MGTYLSDVWLPETYLSGFIIGLSFLFHRGGSVKSLNGRYFNADVKNLWLMDTLEPNRHYAQPSKQSQVII